MDTTHARAAALLIDELRELRRRAASPTFEDLAVYSQQATPETFRRLLTGHRASLPRWKQVAEFVDACHAAANLIGMDTSQLGTIDEWLKRWESAENGDLEPPSIFAPTVPLNPVEVQADPSLQAAIDEMLQRLDKDLLRLQRSLSQYTGLLIAINGPKFGTIFTIKSNVTTIGRHPGSDIPLLENSISHRHAEILRFGDQFTIRDVGSLNGIVRTGIRIRESALRSYDVLRIGRLKFLFVQGGDHMERFQSPRYDAVRRSLVQEIIEDTARIEPASSSDEPDRD